MLSFSRRPLTRIVTVLKGNVGAGADFRISPSFSRRENELAAVDVTGVHTGSVIELAVGDGGEGLGGFVGRSDRCCC